VRGGGVNEELSTRRRGEAEKSEDWRSQESEVRSQESEADKNVGVAGWKTCSTEKDGYGEDDY